VPDTCLRKLVAARSLGCGESDYHVDAGRTERRVANLHNRRRRLDPVRLTDVVNRIRRCDYGRIHSLLMVRNERLVVEEYFEGWTADVAHTLQSVTKSVATLGAGLAIDRGSLRLADTVTTW